MRKTYERMYLFFHCVALKFRVVATSKVLAVRKIFVGIFPT